MTGVGSDLRLSSVDKLDISVKTKQDFSLFQHSFCLDYLKLNPLAVGWRNKVTDDLL